MRPVVFVPPALVLLLGGIWLGLQRRSIAELDQQKVLLETTIQQLRATSAPRDAGAPHPESPGESTKKKTKDWNKIAAQLVATPDEAGLSDMQFRTQLREQLMAMSQEELGNALDEIATLDLTPGDRAALEWAVNAALIQKAPEMALTRFIDRLHQPSDPLHDQLSRAFKDWAKQDSSAAVAWFDRQIAAGKFEGKSLDGNSLPRSQFEGALFRILLESNPNAAANRLTSFPPEHRKAVLNFSRGNLSESDAPVFARIVREQLPAEDQIKTLTEFAPVDTPGDHHKVTDYLNRIEATPAEREACVVNAGHDEIEILGLQREIKRDDVDRMRDWLSKEAPGVVNRVTGEALADTLHFNSATKFSQAAELALHYHANGGGDELLLPLLNHSKADDNRDIARTLASQLSDETKREEYLRNFQ